MRLWKAKRSEQKKVKTKKMVVKKRKTALRIDDAK